MDDSETLVSAHLAHRGYVDVVYEPDGNVPPDFLVNGQIAVEVRRLNQNHFDADDAKGLEEVGIHLWKKIKELLSSLGAPTSGVTWFVFFRFSRPVEAWKTLKPKLQSALVAFMASPIQTKGTIFSGNGIELDVFKASSLHANYFVMGGCSDQQSGGWLLAKMEANIRYCASEKSGKISKVREKYETWWLALVDYIGFGLDEFDRELFRDQVSIQHDWDKIVLIDPRDPARWFEI